MPYYAHSQNDRGERHALIAHLEEVAHLTEEYATAFGAGELGRYLGLWHDLGKFHPVWQDYLLRSEAGERIRNRPDHKGAGALLALRHFDYLAFLIQAHHGGLQTQEDFKDWFRQRNADPAVRKAFDLARQEISDLEPPTTLAFPSFVRDSVTAEMFLRMLFSALVDADSLDTAGHKNPEHAEQRGSDLTLAELWERFAQDQQELFAKSDPDSRVNQARREMYDAGLAAAEQPTGLFRLTVPTGGGKTRSALAFALQHATRHDLRRIIVAVPYLTITDQTAQTYRNIFSDADDDRPVVLEHHSMADRGDDGDDEEDFRPEKVWERLAAENWDAPVIVTTTVQLFESLFARDRTGARKLHRLARSVIIIDEAQTLPAHLLQPILDVLRQLCAHYGTTVVLSTATQPAFNAIRAFSDLEMPEIVPYPEPYFARLKRVTYDWRTEQPVTWEEVADWVRDEPQALVVLNTKKDALALLDALHVPPNDPVTFHLSTLLCGAHRRRVIAEITRRLKAQEPCRVIATQVVEAGIDLDFPLVLRALGPLDSIIQAAGRCNREGKLPEPGRVIVFEPLDGGMPKGAYHIGAEVTVTLRQAALLDGADLDPDDPEVARQYFQRLFSDVNTDREGIQHLRGRLNYPEVARRFQMIDGETESVVITNYGPPEERAQVQRWLDQLYERGSDARKVLRRLQPYIVSVYRNQLDRYRREGFVTEVRPGVWQWHGKYDETRGIVTENPELDSFIV